jgi:hypothetical protein
MSPNLKIDGRAPKLKVAIINNLIKMAVLYVELQPEQCHSQFDSHWKHGYILANFMSVTCI